MVHQDPPTSLRIERESRTLTRKVGDGLRRAILSGQFEPGQRLVERTLCELTGVSRTAVREALRALEAEGLVVNVPNRGPVVASISREEALDIYTVRSLLEVAAVEAFVEKATKQEVAQLGRLMDDMERAASKNDSEQVNALKSRFYAALLEGSRSKTIMQILQQLYAKIALLRRMTMDRDNRTQTAVRELRTMYDAIKSRDAAAAKAACLYHVKAAAEVAISALAEAAIAEEPRRPQRRTFKKHPAIPALPED
jgi:DNA-binding GntR family transcriptional regulator